ncbi:tRNA (adenine(37)-N6)-methyltransferase [Enoplosus armatus]|uniref:tRNA (adenine(37)-N6)-methyltransferase n=1 Tax=Enoplosus armatus TaxID=215367 RepID=UPI0039952C11
MGPLCGCCGEHIDKLSQQVSVMRKEIKNLRQMLDSAVRAHRKHMTSVQSAVSKMRLCEPDSDQTPPPPSPASPQAALEQGNIQTVPIGHISSCFSVKNGTPRQPTICGPSRAELRIQQIVFNNPEHALVGLEHYSHVWIIFLFHKNGHLSYKAKVKPPRLNGQRVGVYSTRSPHRPNALGLTLAKLDKIVGDTIHLSDIDMITGTPVLDIKPYIPEYDSPHTRMGIYSEPYDSNTDQPQATTVSLNETTDMLNLHNVSETDAQSGLKNDLGSLFSRDTSEADIPVTDSSRVSDQFSLPKDLHGVLEEVKAYVTQGDLCQLTCESEDEVSVSPKTKPPELTVDHPCYGEEAYSTIAGWIRDPPVGGLEVRFTPHAERELAEFLPTHLSGPSERDRPRFKFLCSPKEAAAAIRGVLAADPRSVYRRTCCRDKLFFFTLDTADITCWFGRGFAEVLQVRPVEQHV